MMWLRVHNTAIQPKMSRSKALNLFQSRFVCVRQASISANKSHRCKQTYVDVEDIGSVSPSLSGSSHTLAQIRDSVGTCTKHICLCSETGNACVPVVQDRRQRWIVGNARQASRRTYSASLCNIQAHSSGQAILARVTRTCLFCLEKPP